MRLTTILLATCYLLLAPTAKALASESALSVSPAILETVLEINRPTHTTINVQNNTNFPLPIKGSASSFLATQPLPSDNLESFDASRWFTLTPADFILQPNEVKPIKVTITPPKNAEPGGHYATLFFRPLIPQEAVSANSTLSLARIGVLAMMIVPGDITSSLKLNSLTAPSWRSFGPISLTANLTNNGNIHLLPLNTLTIHNIWGQQLANLSADPHIILPHTTQDYVFNWDQKLGLGPYTATLTTTYGTDQPSLTADPLIIWLFPWPVILLVICTLTLVYKIFIVNRKRLALAFAVLKGQHEIPETPQKIPRHNPRSRHRAHSLHPPRTPQRSPRR